MGVRGLPRAAHIGGLHSGDDDVDRLDDDVEGHDDHEAVTLARPSDDPPRGGGEATVLKTVQSVGAVVGPTALVTALLFYFGWARVNAQASYLGLDVTLFDFSTQDYILQSVSSVYVPLAEVLVGALLLLWAHRLVSGRLERQPELPVWPRVEGALAAVGAVAFIVGVAFYNDETPTDTVLLLTPLCLLAGLGLVSYAVLIDRRRRAGPPTGRANSSGAAPVAPLSIILVSLLLMAGLVWEVANYADVKGRQLGQFVADQLAFRPGVVVYSEKRLQIDQPGVTETRFDEPDSAYRFRYEGLKLLLRSSSRFFLVPGSWSVDSGTTIVLPESTSLRLEFVRGG